MKKYVNSCADEKYAFIFDDYREKITWQIFRVILDLT